MSGGRYEYAYRQIEMLADNISYETFWIMRGMILNLT